MWTHYIELSDGDAKGGRRCGDTKRVCRVSSVKEQGRKHGGTYIEKVSGERGAPGQYYQSVHREMTTENGVIAGKFVETFWDRVINSVNCRTETS